jgi:hypothetical protein
MDGPGRVGRDELDHHPLAMPEVEPPILALPCTDDVPQHVVQPRGGKVKIDEPRPSDVDGGHVRRGRGVQQLGDLRGQLPRVPPSSPSRSQGNVGGPLPMLPPSRPLERDDLGQGHPKLPKSRPKSIIKCGANHGVTSGARRKRAKRSDATDPHPVPNNGFGPRSPGALPCDTPPS